MKIKIDHIIFISLVFHILSTQGVLMYLFFDLFGVWEIKSLIHPLSFLMLVCSFFLKAKTLKVKYEDFLFGFYAVFLIVLLLINVDSFFSFYIGFREVFFVLILTFLFNHFHFNSNNYKLLSNLLNVLIIINLLMVALTYYMGPVAFMEMLTGRYQWGVDEITNFQISNYLGMFWRTPAAVGSSGALAYFALFSYLFFDIKKNQNFKKLLAFMLLFSTFTRSALLCLVVYEGLKYFSLKSNIIKLIKYGKILIPVFIAFVVVAYYLNVFSIESLLMRFDIWTKKINVDYNWLFGGSIGDVGGAIRGEGEEAILDNYWLFMLYSTGLLGIVIWLIFFLEKAKVSKKKFYFTIGIICSGGFVMLTQAIPFLVMFPLLFANFKAIDDER